MSLRHKFAFSLIWVIALVAGARAEEAIRIQGQVSAEILGKESGDAFAARLRDAVAPVDYGIIAACPEPRIFQFRTVGSFAPNDQIATVLAGAGKIVWLIEIKATGCSAERLHNLYVFPQPDREAVMVAGFPGRTEASLDLQASGLDALAQLAPTLSEGCTTDPVVVDTQVLETSTEGKPWVEEWSLKVCGATKRVKAVFTPGPNGIALNIETDSR